MLLTQDEGVKTFISNLTAQLSGKFPFSIWKICAKKWVQYDLYFPENYIY